MHIAVYDDNLVDRNQTNRLLTRISDERKKNGLEGYFIDLFGNFESLKHSIAMYDAIILDIVDEEIKGHEIAEKINDIGINGKIILCISKIDYRTVINEKDILNYLYINKPLKIPELKDVLEVCEFAKLNRVPKIELRSDTETIYITADEFMYAYVSEPGKITAVLSFEKSLTFLSDIDSLKRNVDIFKEIIQANTTTLINVNHIKNISTFSVEMDDDTTFRTLPGFRKRVEKVSK